MYNSLTTVRSILYSNMQVITSIKSDIIITAASYTGDICNDTDIVSIGGGVYNSIFAPCYNIGIKLHARI